MGSEIKFSFYQNIKQKESIEITLDDLLSLLENEKVESAISDYRNGKRKKEELPAFTPAGVFVGGHSKNCFKFGNNIVHIDIDKLSEAKVEELMSMLSKDNNILLAFRSVGGNGVKVFAKYKNIDYSNYERYVLDFIQYFSNAYSKFAKNIDDKCKDLSRLCFISFDSKYIYNSAAWELDLMMEVDENEVNSYAEIGGSEDEIILNKIIRYVISKGIVFEVGQRNRFINQVSWYSCRAGINREFLEKRLLEMYESEYNRNEIVSVIKSVYTNCDLYFGVDRGKFIKNESEFALNNYLKKNGGLNFKGLFKTIGKIFKVWVKIDERDKRNERFIYCILQDGALIPVSKNVLNDLIKKGLESFGINEELKFEIMAQTKIDEDFIDRVSVDLFVGNDVKYVFNNYIFYLDKKDNNKLKKIKRNEYNGYFLKNYDFSVDYIEGVNECVFSKFLKNAVGEDNFELARLLIGYILAQENNSVRGRAVILMDKNTQEDEIQMSNGGTGKGLFCQALEKILSTAKIDAKKSGSSQFDFQNINEDTRLIIINDIKKTFNFERLYNAITDGLEIERKHSHPFILDSSFGHKFIITSNFLIRIKGSSDERRMFQLTFSDYYNADHTPYDEFGDLFYSWDDSEWSKFYSWMIGCLIEYKEKGFSYLKQLNEEKNKHLKEVSKIGSVSIFNWLTEKFSKNWNNKDVLVIKDLYEEFLKENDYDERAFSSTLFGSYLNKFLPDKGYTKKNVKIKGETKKCYVKEGFKKDEFNSKEELELKLYEIEDTFKKPEKVQKEVSKEVSNIDSDLDSDLDFDWDKLIE